MRVTWIPAAASVSAGLPVAAWVRLLRAPLSMDEHMGANTKAEGQSVGEYMEAASHRGTKSQLATNSNAVTSPSAGTRGSISTAK
jgi:hypothetical protein